ncbi:metallophosphoesterase family protein [Sphingomonas sp.]|uniref:metallophosphoesterase family protein n=1 Tax=Sphingomonas sp. TaxID=28214 RepID=UPI001B297797|nr:metallophosphoesterase family protein [Sphingomonas sp.]MBO9712659.1 serine/threonine protein phosphatase [Sphingomonas sp.]
MLNIFKSRRNRADQPPQGAPGARCYAIGDIHGRLDLLDAMLDRIDAVERSRSPAKTWIVLLGDLIDRGPDSAGVINRLRTREWGRLLPVFLLGNHEEMMLRVLGDEPWLVTDWMTHGGFECAQSYGVPVGKLASLSAEQAAELLRAHIPPEDVAFVQQFADSFRFGDYLFVHAGIRPGIPLERQKTQDLRWIRADFLDAVRDDGLIVVHGHTISKMPDEAPGRIGIDTGAYMGGPLTALFVEGAFKSFLAVESHSEAAKTS